MTKTEQKTFIAPDTYRELNKPFPSAEAADAAIEAFWGEFYELRVKHKLPDVLVVIRANVVCEDGEESDAIVSMHAGSTLHKESMAAWAFGRAQLERQQAIGKMLTKSVKHGVDRQ